MSVTARVDVCAVLGASLSQRRAILLQRRSTLVHHPTHRPLYRATLRVNQAHPFLYLKVNGKIQPHMLVYDMFFLKQEIMEFKKALDVFEKNACLPPPRVPSCALLKEGK